MGGGSRQKRNPSSFLNGNTVIGGGSGSGSMNSNSKLMMRPGAHSRTNSMGVGLEQILQNKKQQMQ